MVGDRARQRLGEVPLLTDVPGDLHVVGADGFALEHVEYLDAFAPVLENAAVHVPLALHE